MKPAYTYKAFCSRVIDGDTIVCDWVDVGFHIKTTDLKFRLFGINAPETRTKDKKEKEAGLKAKQWLKLEIEGKEIIIKTYRDKQQDAFGRYLVEIWLDGVNINDLLVQEGLAVYKQYK